jgi:SWI/SNF-related matrix-associated actin-dependent regulator 1 of chromatin subfamily A
LKQNPKLDALLEMIEDHYDGNKFIIWSTVVNEIEAIRDILAERFGQSSVECYYGKTDMDDRARIEDRYCQDRSMRFFVGNPTAAGLGLTLISGESDVMVYYSGTSAFIDRSQSEDRAHRIGQRNTVVCMDFVMESSVDELIQDAIARKMDISEFVKERLADGSSAIDLLNKYHEEE